MTLIIGLLGFGILVGAIVWFIVASIRTDPNNDERQIFEFDAVKLIPVLIALIICLLSWTSPVQVNAGERGVVLWQGATTSKTVDEGWYFKVPFFEDVQIMDMTTQAFKVEAAAATKDVQDAFLVVTFNYRLDPTQVNKTWQTFKGAHESRIIIPNSQQAIKDSTNKFDAEELVVNRASVRDQVQASMGDLMFQNGMILETVAIENITFSPEFTKALEDKAVAATRIDTAENLKQIAIIDAQTAEEKAKGEANAAFASADGEARSITRIAEAQAGANELLDASLTDELIQWRTVDKLADDIQVIVLPSGQEFILGPEIIRP